MGCKICKTFKNKNEFMFEEDEKENLVTFNKFTNKKNEDTTFSEETQEDMNESSGDIKITTNFHFNS